MMNQYPPQQPNKKKALTTPIAWLGHHPILTIFMILVVVSVGFIGFIAQVTKTSPATAPIPVTNSKSAHPISAGIISFTPAPTIPAGSHWITAQTFTGSGAIKTPSFSVPKNWRIVWSCDLSSHHNTSYYLFIHANTIDNALLANSIETTCNKNNTHNSTVMHQAGKIYLSIISEGKWQVQVQYSK